MKSSAVGLYLSHGKSEMVCTASAGNALLSHVPDLLRVSLDSAPLLGSPVGSTVSIDTAIRTKTDALSIMKSRICYLSRQDAFILLRISFVLLLILLLYI